MSTVRELHDKAMKLAHLAVVSRYSDDLPQAEAYAREAYEYESQAADLIPEMPSSEPTRSILYRSAASLALQCREFAIAQRLIAKGLAGYPPPDVEQELKDLFEQINFENHLSVRGAILEKDDLQISIQGTSVGFGVIVYDEFLRRIVSVRALVERTVQRVMGAPYNRSGRVAKRYRPFTTVLSSARPGSFSITMKLAIAVNEQIPLLVTAADVIDEMMTGVELVNNQDEQSLQDRISEDSYYRNFISLTRNLAPDGDNISFVGFTSPRRSVSLTRHHEQIHISTPALVSSMPLSPISVEGLLDFATARKGAESFGLTTDTGREYDVIVQEGFDDLVRAYFKQVVVVTGQSDGREIYLTDVQPSGE